MSGSKMSSGSGNSAPRIMVFRPTMEEFKNFSKYIEKIESLGAHKAGLAKIIPPPGWSPRKRGYDDVDLIIPAPISQVVSGREGLYQQFNIQKKAMTVKEFQKLAELSRYQTPPHFDYEDLERKYWKNIAFNPPIYGADVSGSLYDDGVDEFNIQHLNTILDLVKEDYEIQIEGVNTAYLYFGMWKTTFAWHTEDMDLYSINYLHYGAPKSWYAIPPEHGRRLERLAENFFSVNSANCSAFLRHKMTIISPQRLKSFCIPCNKITQEPGEFMITFPYGYHSGFNHGFNCAESTNFASTRWVEYGKRAISCTCRNDCVKICMDMFVRKFQPERYELWKVGKDIGAHPEDPSKQYAAPTPKKLDLAMAAQRERKRAKSNSSQKSKRLPISKLAKHKKKYNSELINKAVQNDDSGSEATEIYDIGTGEDIENATKDFDSPQFEPELPCVVTDEPMATVAVMNEDETEIEMEQHDEALSQLFDDGDEPAYVTPLPINSTNEITTVINRQLPSLKPLWDLENRRNGPLFDRELLSQFPALRKGLQSGSIALTCIPTTSCNSSSGPDISILPLKSSSPNCSSLSMEHEIEKEKIQSPSSTSIKDLSQDSHLLNLCQLKPKLNLRKMSIPIEEKPSSDSDMWMCEPAEGLKVRLAKETQQYPKDERVSSSSSSNASPKNSDHIFTETQTPFKPKTNVSSTLPFICSNGEDNTPSGCSNGKLDTPSSANSTNKGDVKMNKPTLVKSDGKRTDSKKRKSSGKTIRAADDRLGNWARPILRLYQHYPFNFEEEKRFNAHCSTIEPHCAICMIFSPSNIADGYPNQPGKLPDNSKVKMPGFCFGKGENSATDNDTNPLRSQDGTSPLLVCTMCNVSVHATCYGVTMVQMAPWTCTRCSSSSIYEIECCLCVMRGGALKPTNDGRWAHILCTILVPEAFFEDIVVKEPINVSKLPIDRQRLKCKYCFKATLNLSTNQGACVQCLSGKCYLPFHVTCGYMAGVLYEKSDWPEPIHISCTAHSGARRKPLKRTYTEIHVGEKVLAKHKVNRRYYWVQVKRIYEQQYLTVLFEDNSLSTNTLPEDIVDKVLRQEDTPEYNEKVKVKWNDGIIYNAIYKGSRHCKLFEIEFDDGTLVTQERYELFAADENIPKEVLSKVGTSTESRIGHLYKPAEGKRMRVSNSKYKSFES